MAMQLAFPIEMDTPDFARHVAFLKDAGVDQVPIYFMRADAEPGKGFGSRDQVEEMIGTFRDQVEEIRRQGLAIDVVYPDYRGRLPNVVADDRQEREGFERLCDTCAELGFRHVGVFPQNPSRETADAAWLDTMVAGSRILSDIVGRHGMTVGYHINMVTGSRLDRPEDVDELFERVGRANVGLLFCFGCVALAGLDVPAMIRRWSDRMFIVHLRDVRGTYAHDPEEARFGTGRIDLAAGLRALADIGYNGILHPEHFPAAGSDQPPERRVLWTQPHDRDAPTIAWTLGYCRGLMRGVLGVSG